MVQAMCKKNMGRVRRLLSDGHLSRCSSTEWVLCSKRGVVNRGERRIVGCTQAGR